MTTLSQGRAVLFATAALLLGVAPLAHAALLIDPTGGTDMFLPTTSDFDDRDRTRNINGTFNFLGVATTQLEITTNGEVYAISSDNYADVLEDDLYLKGGAADFIRENITANYYNVTWNVRGFSDSNTVNPGLSLFQATFFKNAETVDGTAFQSGDIVFSYARINHAQKNSDIDIGVFDDANGTYYGAFGQSNGSFDSIGEILGNFDPATQGILFRYDGTTVSQSLVPTVAVAVPEAGSLALLVPALGVLGAVVIRRRRIVK